MKNIIKTILLTWVLISAFGCNEKEDTKYLGYNEVSFSPLNDLNANKKGAKATVEVALTMPFEKATPIEFAIEGGDEFYQFDNNPLIFEKGELTKMVEISFKKIPPLDEDTKDLKFILKTRQPELKLHRTLNTLTVQRGYPEKELTPEQISIVEDYKTKTGIDLSRFLGNVECDLELTIYKEHNDISLGAIGESFFSNFNGNIYNYSSVSSIVFGEDATKENISLNMEHNAMGLNNIIKEYLHAVIFENNEGQFRNTTARVAWADFVSKKLQELNIRESVDVSLNKLLLKEDKEIEFAGKKVYDTWWAEDEEINKSIPFKFNYSVNNYWNNTDDKITFVDEATGQELTFPISKIRTGEWEEGASKYDYDPEKMLYVSDLEGEEEGTDNRYIEPKGEITKDSITFVFPFDDDLLTGRGAVFGKVTVTYKANK